VTKKKPSRAELTTVLRWSSPIDAKYAKQVADWVDPPPRKSGRKPPVPLSIRWRVHNFVRQIRKAQRVYDLTPRLAIEWIEGALVMSGRAGEAQLRWLRRLKPQVEAELRRAQKRSTN
jgi:hypothetical protein